MKVINRYPVPSGQGQSPVVIMPVGAKILSVAHYVSNIGDFCIWAEVDDSNTDSEKRELLVLNTFELTNLTPGAFIGTVVIPTGASQGEYHFFAQ